MIRRKKRKASHEEEEEEEIQSLEGKTLSNN